MPDISRNVRGRKHPRNPGLVDAVDAIAPYTIHILVCGGGGGAGGYIPGTAYPGGGGGGNVGEGDVSVYPMTTYPVTIGAGGIQPVAPSQDPGGQGGTSSFGTISSLIGGYGGYSPGHGGTCGNGVNVGGVKDSGTPISGGGGGYTANGTNGNSTTPGSGGAGWTSSITGTSQVYGSGGAGTAPGGPGTPGAGYYGRGGTCYPDITGGTGLQGVVILRIPTAVYTGQYTGSSVEVLTDGSYTILRFNANGSYTA